MLGLPEAVLQKPGPLSPDEITLVRTHVKLGEEKIQQSGMSPDVAEIASQHHEREDGSGYLQGFKGSEMKVIGACAGIVDTFGAMTTKRPYADAISPSNVLGIMHKWKDKIFNGWLIEEFIRCIGVFPVGSVVELNSGEVGVVISQNIVRRLQPRVLVVRDSNGNAVHPHKRLDLSKSPKATADEPYRIRRTLEYGRSGVSAQDLFL
jgi:HD-GYP domain-containing protein (c-di-GMP phosphodiesterase class II)